MSSDTLAADKSTSTPQTLQTLKVIDWRGLVNSCNADQRKQYRRIVDLIRLPARHCDWDGGNELLALADQFWQAYDAVYRTENATQRKGQENIATR